MLRILENFAGHLLYFYSCSTHEKDILYLLKFWVEEKFELSLNGLNLPLLLTNYSFNHLFITSRVYLEPTS